MPMDGPHEVYPNAPLVLVSVEVRLPGSLGVALRPLPVNVQRSFRDLLGDNWVIDSSAPQISVSLGSGVAMPQPMQQVTIPRFTIRDRTLAVALTESSVSIETTRYGQYPEFRKVLEKTISAATEVLAPDGVARVGMRYINEIRVPDGNEDNPSGWQDWIDPALLAPQLARMADKGFASGGWEGAAQYETGPDQKLVLRYGTRNGYVVNPSGPLKRPCLPGPGPLFMLDFDCFWEPPDIPEFNPKAIVPIFDELHTPVRTLFDLLVTDKLLGEFRRERNVG